jgi:hypothetical protein
MRRAAAVTAFLVALIAAGPAHGDAGTGCATGSCEEPRPWDAPRLREGAARPSAGADAPSGRGELPPVPPEYLTQDGGWIQFAYHPSARERVRPLIARANDVRAELSALLGRGLLPHVEVRVAAVPAEMARLAPSELPGYAPAVAISELGLVVMSLSSPLSLEPPDLEALFRHQLAHLALDEALGEAGPSSPRRASVPRWFHEGFAVQAGGDHSALRARTMTIASLRQRIAPMSMLEVSFPHEAPEGSVAYAQAADFVRFLLGSERRAALPDLVRRLREGEPFQQALGAAYQSSPEALEAAWRRDVAKHYSFVPVLGAAALLWLVAAAVAVARRVRNQRKERLLEARRSRRDARMATAEKNARESLREQRAKKRARDRLDQMPIETEVPKIEHGGRWHTLH